MNARLFFSCFLLVLFCTPASSQFSCSKWYFGIWMGLDFSTSPPTPVNNSAMVQMEGGASIADEAGNLLFYTNGFDVWNAQHVIMANGSGLTGNQSSTQSALIAKQPGNTNLYYIFTVGDSGIDTLAYSVVDMNLAAGSGSVVVKNSILAFNMTEKLTGTKHCNGVDYWILAHDFNSNNFRAYLLNAAGLNPSPVITSVGSVHTGTPYGFGGSMKISPTGKKIGLGVCAPLNTFELYDFDNTTGIVSNSLAIGTNTLCTWAYGCEFSADGTKFYGNSWYGLFQWNLCTSPPASYVVDSFNNWGGVTQLQLGPDGKIYDMRGGTQAAGISVINNPNLAGAACNYSQGGQAINAKAYGGGAPNFIGSLLRQPAAPRDFSVTTSCNIGIFTAPSFSVVGCSNSGSYSVTSLQWNFGDPLSGPANSATTSSASHIYSSAGTFTASLIVRYSCGGGTDTIRKPVTVTQTCLTYSSNLVGCLSSAVTVSSTVGTGAFSYTWLPGMQTGATVSGITPGSYSIVVYDAGSNNTFTAGVVLVNNSMLAGTSVIATTMLPCFSSNTGTAQLTGPSPGGSSFVSWDGGTAAPVFSASGLSAGQHTMVLTHPGSGCSVTRYFTISSPAPITIGVSAATPSTCAGKSVTLLAVAAGGSPNYTYTWTGGPSTNTYNTSQQNSGSFAYTVTAQDANSCVATSVYSQSFIPPPTITVNTPSICPGKVTVLTASGANSYTWSTGSFFSGIGAAPNVTTQYTVTGLANTCTAAVVATIHVYSIPSIQISNNSPVCTGKPLQLAATGGTSYNWYHNQNSSQQQFFTIPSASISDAGVYNVYIVTVNGCTATASTSVTINSTPSVLIQGTSTLCAGTTLSLNAVSQGGNSFQWTGPDNFTSSLQAVSINSVSAIASGYYSLSVSSSQGCTTSAVANVSVVTVPAPNITSNSPLCSGKVLIVGSTGSSWTGPNGFTSSTPDFSLSNTAVQATGIYTLTSTNGPCMRQTTLAIVVHPVPSLTLQAVHQHCENAPITMSVNGSANPVYSWSGPGAQSATGSVFLIPSVTLNQSGIYSVTAITAQSCLASASTTLQVLAAPVLTLTGKTEICAGETTLLHIAGADTYSWSMNNGSSTISLSPAQTQSYSVIGTNVQGCSTEWFFLVSVSACDNLSTVSGVNGRIGVFPNPATNNVTISNLSGDQAIELYDEAGKLVKMTRVSKTSTTVLLKVDDLADGMYLIVIKNANGEVQVQEKLIKQN